MKSTVKSLMMVIAMYLLTVGACIASNHSAPEIIKIKIPVTLRPISLHKEMTSVYDDLNWGRHTTSFLCEIVNWEVPAVSSSNARILKYLDNSRKELNVSVGGEIGGTNIKALGKIPGLTGSISTRIRITGILEAWTYEGTDKSNPVRVRLIKLNQISKSR